MKIFLKAWQIEIEKNHLTNELEKTRAELCNLRIQSSNNEKNIIFEYESKINELSLKSDNLSTVFLIFYSKL